MRHIRTGDKEPIEIVATNALGQRLIGLTNIKLQVRRTSDNYYLDWTDNTFRALPAQLLQDLDEIDENDSPGEYQLHAPLIGHSYGFDTSVLTNAIDEDTYRMLAIQSGSPQNASNVPQLGHLKVGGFIDFVDQSISDNATPDEVKEAMRDYGLDHLVSVNPGIVPPASNTYIRQILDKEDQIIAGQERFSLEMAWAYRKTSDELMGLVWVESANLVVLTATTCTVNWCEHGVAGVKFSVSGVGPDARGVFSVTKANPALVSNTAYYAEATVEIPSYGTIKGVKGNITLG